MTTFLRESYGFAPFMAQPAQDFPVAEFHFSAPGRMGTQASGLGNPDVPVEGTFWADHPALFEKKRALERGDGFGILDFMGLEDGRMRNC